MARPWIGRIVKLAHMDGGTWKVAGTDGAWCECQPIDTMAETLASITPDRVVWFRKQELHEAPSQEETLL